MASQAAAAVPSPQPDALRAFPTGVQDVLANDSDPDGDALTVVATSAPTRGTVTCSALGACQYTAASREQGTDSFTYTVRDTNGEQATAKVDVTIQASSTSGTVSAVDDEVATAAGADVTVPVLANDNGTGLTVINGGAAKHGSATCGETSCTYRPEAGYSGTDGFTYTIMGSGERTSTGQVHVLVAPAGAGYKLGADHASSSPVAPGGTASWTVGVQLLPD